MVIAAIVMVIISRGMPKRPMIPNIKNAAKKFGTTPMKDNIIFLKRIKNIADIPIITIPKVKTDIMANNIAIPVKIPKYIVGIKFDKTKIEKPKTMVIEVFKIAIPTVL